MSTATNGRAREYWADIPECPGYSVSSLGRVRSSLRWKGSSERILKQFENTSGYLIVRPRTESGRQRTMTVHTLVATAFHGDPLTGQMVRHLNGDRRDNRAENLRWGTRQENAEDSIAHGTHFPGSLTHCVKRGHPLSGSNLYVYPGTGKRMCRACRTANRKEASA